MRGAMSDTAGDLERFKLALEQLIAVARFYVGRDESDYLWTCLHAPVGLHVLAVDAFHETDRACFFAHRPRPENVDVRAWVGHPHNVGISMYKDALAEAWLRWQAFPEWWRDLDGKLWRGRAYPADFPRADHYSLLPAELAMLRGALELLRIPEVGETGKTSQRAEEPIYQERPSVAAILQHIGMSGRYHAGLWDLHRKRIIDLIELPADGEKPAYAKWTVLRPDLLKRRWRLLRKL
jgi:hypothetical protein